MNKNTLNNPCVKITLKINGKDVSHGTGTLLRGKDGFYVITAHHCIYGEKNIFHNIQIDQIIIEKQPAFNASFNLIAVDKIIDSDIEDDWAVVKVQYEDIDGLYPIIKSSLNFKFDDEVIFTGFQAVNKNEYRSFKSRVLNIISEGEFRITLTDHDVFKAGRDDAIGLSGSGAFLIHGNDFILIGILKKVKGDEALNNDIICCSIEKIAKIIGLELNNIDSNNSSDNFGSQQYGKIIITDKRDLMEKILAVNTDFSEKKMKRLRRQLALGKAELELIQDRDISAIKYRLFEKCQEVLEDFVDENVGTILSTDQIEDLIKKFTDTGIKIISVKSKMYDYPILDDDLMRKIILDLINECYLSFDKEGIYVKENLYATK